MDSYHRGTPRDESQNGFKIKPVGYTETFDNNFTYKVCLMHDALLCQDHHIEFGIGDSAAQSVSAWQISENLKYLNSRHPPPPPTNTPKPNSNLCL